jgi:hypothetical protein
MNGATHQSLEQHIADLRHQRQQTSCDSNQHSLSGQQVLSSLPDRIPDTIFDQFISRLREAQISPQAPSEDSLFDQVRALSAVVGLELEHQFPALGSAPAQMVPNQETARATQLALRRLCDPRDALSRSEDALRSLLVTYTSSNDPAIFTAQGILSQARDFFAEVAERRVTFEDLVKVLLVATYIRSQSYEQIDWEQVCKEIRQCFFDNLVEYLLTFQGSYLSAQDLKELGVASNEWDRVLARVSQQQLMGEITSRRQALLATLQELGGDTATSAQRVLSERMQLFLQRTGSTIDNFIIRQQDDTPISYPDSEATCTFFRCVSREQFPQGSDDEISFEILHSGNYPAIVRELRYADLSDRDVIAKMRSKQVLNLVEFEEFCESLTWRREHLAHAALSSLKNVQGVTSSKAVFAEVRCLEGRRRGPEEGGRVRCITLGLGYQGADHEGTGINHVIQQRSSDPTFRKFMKPGETVAVAVERFIRDGVLHTAGHVGLRLPSRLSPATHSILIGKIHDTENQFISLVLGRVVDGEDLQDSEEVLYLVTALFHKNAAALRQSIKREIAGWAEQQDALNTRWLDQFYPLLERANRFCELHEIEAITYHEVMPVSRWKPAGEHAILSASSAEDESDQFVLELVPELESLEGDFFRDSSRDDDAAAVEVPGLEFAMPSFLRRRR